jgi:AcrR family transcriptional regulator
MSPTSDRHLRADARRNRDRLLAAAHEAFRRDCVSTSLDEIARNAAVGIGTLYRHFPTREDLIAALVTADLERVAALADDLADDDADDALGRWLAELVAHTATYRGLAEVVLAATNDRTAFGSACERVHTAGAALVQRAQQRGTVRADIEPRDVIDIANAIAWATECSTDLARRERLVRINVDGLRIGTVQGARATSPRATRRTSPRR